MKAETKSFKANTHYNDWFGTISTDNMDINNIYKYFEDGIRDEYILGIEANILFSSKVSVTIYTTNEVLFNEDGTRINKKHPVLNEYKKDIPIEDLFQLFKQVNFKLSPKNKLATGKFKVNK